MAVAAAVVLVVVVVVGVVVVVVVVVVSSTLCWELTADQGCTKLVTRLVNLAKLANLGGGVKIVHNLGNLEILVCEGGCKITGQAGQT